MQPAGEIFPPVAPPVVFPAPPDEPRLAYVGSLSTDRDLKPAVSGWEQFTRAISGPSAPQSVSAPAGLCVSEDERVYVTDPPQRCVHIFDLANRRYRAIRSAGAAPLQSPADAALAGGRLYVTDAARGTVDIFTPDGDYQASWSEPHLVRPVGISFETRSGQLYVVDSGRHDCAAYSLDGTEVLRFGRRGEGPGEFNFPTFVTADARHGLLIADSMNARVQHFTLEGRPIGAIGRKGDAAGDLSLPKGTVFDAQGRILVADAHFENIQVFDPDGRLLMAFGEEGQSPGQFWLPAKLYVDARRRLWVADSYNRRVQVFRFLEVPPS